MSILTLLAIPGVMDQQGRRLAAQKPERHDDAPDLPGSTPPLVAMYQEDDVDGRLMSRILVANPRPEAVLPYWLTEYPEPGEIVVSPAVARQLADPDSAVARRFFHLTVIQEIADEGLVSPDQLMVVVGVTGAELAPFSPSAIPATGLGQPAEAYPGPAPNAIRTIVVAGAVFMIIPALVLTATAARLSARTRQRRLAVFRLIGLSARHTAAINAIETAAVTLVGAIIGVLTWNALVPVSEPIGLGRLRWFAEDVTVPFWVQAGLVGVLVVLAVVVSSTGSVPALIDPLAERRSVPKPIAGRRLIRLAPLILGALLLVGAAIYPTPNNMWFAVFAAGNALAAIGLFTAMPVLAAKIGGRLARRSSAAPVRLAGGRLARK
ncbi:MAG: FtsX-like permease family protein, partial [Geodermatophilaceae bacterium]